MDSQLIQRTRYQLQTRTRAARTCPTVLFPNACKLLLEWIDTHPLLRSVLEPLRLQEREYHERLMRELTKLGTPQVRSIRGPFKPKTRDEATALCMAALRLFATYELDEENDREPDTLALLVGGYNPEEGSRLAEIVDVLRDVALSGLHDYLDEAIDSRNAVLALLLKYKTRCEMYRRQRLRAAAEEGLEGRRGERALAFDLYEYLHDQGVDFAIEPVSASGEPDLVSPIGRGERLVADAKYVGSVTDVKRTVASGFRQVLDYCRDQNEPIGYLVVFLNRDVRPALPGERDDAFPCFRAGGHTVYYVFIDIFEHGVTASKRPKPTEVQITEADILAASGGERGSTAEP